MYKEKSDWYIIEVESDRKLRFLEYPYRVRTAIMDGYVQLITKNGNKYTVFELEQMLAILKNGIEEYNKENERLYNKLEEDE